MLFQEYINLRFYVFKTVINTYLNLCIVFNLKTSDAGFLSSELYVSKSVKALNDKLINY